MWRAESLLLPQYKAIKYHIRDYESDRELSYAEVIELCCIDTHFRNFISSVLLSSPFDKFRWEVAPVSTSTIDRSFQFVLIDAPELSDRASTAEFSEYFLNISDSNIVVFPNLGLDAMLIVPTPDSSTSNFSHLKSFLRESDAIHQQLLWQRVGEELKDRLSCTPIWLNTAGDGVAWVHIRLDSMPKYYRYSVYRT